MINDLILLQQLMDKFKLSEPVPAAVRNFVLRSQKKTLISILQKLKIYTPIFGIVLLVFFWLKKLGFKVTVFKTMLVIGLGSLLLTASISLGIYNITRKSSPLHSSLPSDVHDVNSASKKEGAVDNSTVIFANNENIVDDALIWKGDLYL